jgi:hypothetical protein
MATLGSAALSAAMVASAAKAADMAKTAAVTDVHL